MDSPPWYVLTGAPSSGKSTLLQELAGRGYHTSPEAARYIIEKEVAAGKDFLEVRSDASTFQHNVLRLKLEWEKQLPKTEIVFLERGIPDSLAYYRYEDVLEDEEITKACTEAVYRKVFLLDLVSKEHFESDAERVGTWHGALEIDRLLEEVYRSFGHTVVRVPVMSVEQRADMIIENL